MVDRVWTRMFDETGNGRWEMTCPSPRDGAEAAAQGRALRRALSAHPDRHVFCRVPRSADPLVGGVVQEAGLVPLSEAIWVSRGPWDGGPRPWPGGLTVRTAAEIGYDGFASAVGAVQVGSLDWPEFQALGRPEEHVAAMIRPDSHRPAWWFRFDRGDRPVGLVLFDAFDTTAHHYTFLGIAPVDRRSGLAVALFEAAFSRLPAGGLVAAVDARNLPSRRMLRATGFREEPGEVYWWRPGAVPAG